MIIYFFVFQIHNEGISRIRIEEQENFEVKSARSSTLFDNINALEKD